MQTRHKHRMRQCDQKYIIILIISAVHTKYVRKHMIIKIIPITTYEKSNATSGV